jgi:hypothetical protein
MESVENPFETYDTVRNEQIENLKNQEHELLMKEVEKDMRMANPKGLGDLVEKALHSKTLKPLTEKLKETIFGDDGEDCGCDGRRELLNKIGLSRDVATCLNEKQYNALKKIPTYEQERLEHGRLRHNWANAIQKIHSEVFSHRVTSFCSSCGSGAKTLRNWDEDLRKLVAFYESEIAENEI